MFVVLFSFCSAVKMQSDLFDLQPTFQPSMQSASTGLPVATAWAGTPFYFLTLSSSNQHHGSACFPSLVAVVWLIFTSSSHLSLFLLFFFPFLSFSCLSSACIDPFTSGDAGDDSMPNLNPFLSKLVVDATHLPVVSSDGVSFSSRTSGHEVFGGNSSFCFSSKLLFLVHISVYT